MILGLTMISEISFAQQVNEKINYIAFKFEHSRRIPNYMVTIEIIKRQAETVVKVNSIPRGSDKRWANTKIDTSFIIASKLFVDLANEVLALNKTNLTKALLGGKDGTECTIEFGTFGSTVAYKFWSPDYDTEQRGLTDFLKLCKKLIEIGGLKTKEIL